MYSSYNRTIFHYTYIRTYEFFNFRLKISSTNSLLIISNYILISDKTLIRYFLLQKENAKCIKCILNVMSNY